ncbi:MAG: M57 family metalloprotease [Saprospiraceae bacterium]|nr:M57 family metalloprotease [Saprospiraceae bacterium]
MRLIKLTGFLMALFIFSCQPESGVTPSEEELTGISAEIKAKIINLGFNPKDSYKVEGGYMIEGDIFLTDEDLVSLPNHKLPILEQYRTTNLVSVTGTRTITVSLANNLSTISNALNEAIARYNAEPLTIKFQRVNNNGNIKITKAPFFAQYLASAGFPSSTGNPYSSILFNLSAVNGQSQGTVASILAHEMGHCIGFRHTDYYNRAISCGGSASNEGNGGVGAIIIPGTPSTATLAAQSWMLSCIASGQDRPFNNDDKTALTYLY